MLVEDEGEGSEITIVLAPPATHLQQTTFIVHYDTP